MKTKQYSKSIIRYVKPSRTKRKRKITRTKRNRKVTRTKRNRKVTRTNRIIKVIRIKRSQHSKNAIINPPLSDNKLLGTIETMGSMNYFYQKYSNIYKFFKIITVHYRKTGEYKLENICMPEFGNIERGSFAALRYNIDNKYSSTNPTPSDHNTHMSQALSQINHCLNNKTDRFVTLSYQIVSYDSDISHANSLLFDNVNKTIELFEPHSALTDSSTMEGIVGAYKIINTNLKKFIKAHFKNYKYISPQEYLPSYGLQINYDAYNGLCVTWNILYIHYKLLNPNIDSKKLVRHINNYFNVGKLLRYGKYVKEMLKLRKSYDL